MNARWIDLGDCGPEQFHATYSAIAECMAPDDDPVMVWGRPAAHFCLGAHQSAEFELHSSINVPVLRRPLGGGGVWLDPDQVCWVLIAPRQFYPSRPQDWFAHVLAPMLQVFIGMGWDVALVGSDIRMAGRKLAGSGAATIGHAGLVGSSFLLDFPVEVFADLIHAPSDGFRRWLVDALTQQMTWWCAHAKRPSVDVLSLTFRRALAVHFDWRWQQALLGERERAACVAAVDELQVDDWVATRKLVPWGIKIRGDCYLTERCAGEWCARVLTQDGRMQRVWLSALPAMPDDWLADTPWLLQAMVDRLQEAGGGSQASDMAQLILQTAWSGDD